MRGKSWMRIPALAAGAVLGLGLAACGDGVSEPERHDLGADEAANLALVTDAVVGGVIFEQAFVLGGFRSGTVAGGGSDEKSFSRSRDCPAGGTLEVEGTITRTQAGEGAVEVEVEGSGAWNDCAHSRNDVTVRRNGSFTFEAYRKRANGKPVGLQTTRRAGSFTWERSDGRSGSCDFDVTSTLNPESGTRRVTGTMCGRTIDRTVNWGGQG